MQIAQVTTGTATGSGSMSDDRLQWHLLNWKAWMHAGHTVDGYPRRSTCLQSNGASHFDDMADASDTRSAIACNAVIESLPQQQANAVAHQFLGCRYQHHPVTFIISMERARESIRKGLEQRGIW